MFETSKSGYASCTPEEVQPLLRDGNVQLLDVREVREFQHCRIEGAINIPLALLPLRIHELDRTMPTVVLCHHGSRSYFACRLLEKEGFRSVINLTGGINMWARTVDTSIPVY
jgi:rhodanese-related sulfurtransferase